MPGGSGIGTLTVAGDYRGNGGTLAIATAAGADGPVASRLVVTGATAGDTRVTITDRSGLAAPTADGLELVEVDGASHGDFTLAGDYLFAGRPTIVAGAYGYQLDRGGVATPGDGNWYLRSASAGGSGPLYQPGVPVYENYARTLLTLGELPSLQERVGERRWGQSVSGARNGIWGRLETSRLRPEAHVSATGTDAAIDSWHLQAGIDRMLADGGGSTLVAGLTAHYGRANATVHSAFGDGSIRARGYGFGATLTWYARDGFYADGQAQVTWFKGRLASSVLGALADDDHGTGEAASLEVGKRSAIGDGLTLTPQIQMRYQNARFDAFEDPMQAAVSSHDGDSLKTRWGLSIDQTRAWRANGASRRTHLYGLVNLSYEWLDGTRVDVAGTPIRNADDRLWGEAAIGGSVTLGDRLTLYSQVSAASALRDFGDGYELKGTAGLRLAF